MGKSRDIEVDVLRSIGILLIILAHIKAPLMLTIIRCFDVPLMVFVSGLCYSGKTLMGGGTKSSTPNEYYGSSYRHGYSLFSFS